MYVVNDVHYFSNITDFMSTVKDAPTLSGRNTESKNTDRGFSGTSNIDEAWQLLADGYVNDRGQKLLDSMMRLNATLKQSKQFNDVVGFAPHVPNYLMGIPKTMVNREVKIFRDKIVNVLVNTSVSGGTSTEYIFEKATEVFEVIVRLEQEGYRVNLYKMIGSSKDNGKSVLGFIKMKDDKERMNLRKLLFPMTHPSMQRRLDFRFRECFGQVDVTHDGYGSQRNWTKSFVDKSFKRLCPTDYLYCNLHEYDPDWYKKPIAGTSNGLL